MSRLTLNIKRIVGALTGVPSDNSFLTPVSQTAKQALAHETVNQYLRDELAIANVTITQLKFLLAQAPMIDAPLPSDPMHATRLRQATAPFAYINPKTMSGLTWGIPPNRIYVFPGSSTKYVLTSLMPEGRILYSPLQIPGLERTLAA